MRNYIGGSFIDAVDLTFESTNPVNGSLAAHVAEVDRDTVNAAVKAGRSALEGPWGRMAVNDRAALLRRIADRIDVRFEDLLEAEVAGTGKRVTAVVAGLGTIELEISGAEA